VRLGIIGAGAVVQVAHLPVLRKLKGIDIRALCDSDLPKARALAQRTAIRSSFDDIEEMLRHEELDAILIATPNHLHEPHIEAALAADLHVLVEKPLALTAAGARRIAKLADKSDRVVMVGMTHRFRPDVQAVRSFVQAGELSCLQCHAQRTITMSINTYANDTARHFSFIGFTGCKESSMRSAVTKGNSEPL
jgi:predicted dehydrogenase